MAGEPTMTVTGNLAADPEYRPVGETGVASFRIGSTPWKTVDGERQNGTTLWLDVEAWGALGEQTANLLKKGHTVLVQGALMQDEWTNEEGQVRSRFKLRATNIGVDIRFQTVSVTKNTPQGTAIPVQTTAPAPAQKPAKKAKPAKQATAPAPVQEAPTEYEEVDDSVF